MRALVSRIIEELEMTGHCAVYETELECFWPLSERNREDKIRKFSEENGFRLRFYKEGLCAIFDKEPVGGP
jgi:hypothetical protein